MDNFKFVVDNSEYVSINIDKLDSFVSEINEVNYIHWSKEVNLDLTEKQWILLAFIIESMNFCFWKKPKWKIQYKDEILSGSNALFFTIIKAIDNNKNFLDIDYLKSITENDFKEIFRGISGECPLLEKRYENFKEVINYVISHNFYDELYSIKNDVDLVNYIINNFKSFDDKSLYKGRTIYFNKRATLLANDLYYLSSTIRENVDNVNNLSGCADYGIPRTFRDYGLLVYNKELSDLVDNELLIEHDSNMEIEIRANMLYLIELIKEKLNLKGLVVNSVELDNIIWNIGKNMKNRSNVHQTVTIYY